MTPHIYVICPAATVTGGTELLHQLVDALNLQGRPASIVYHPFEEQHSTPIAFARYDSRPSQRNAIKPGDRVVLPEVFPELVSHFKDCQINFWWMSVDNFFGFVRKTRVERVLPLVVIRWRKIVALRRHVDLHLYQSEYARLYLEHNKLTPSTHLADYLANEYLEDISQADLTPRDDIVVYNPKKGVKQAAAIHNELERVAKGAIQMVPIQNMSRDEVRALLRRAKIYIDFGNHPGMDRIPREAAAMGCSILVNKRGSAGNDIDVPIDEFYKVDDRKRHFAKEAVSKILSIVSDFATHQASFDKYRQRTANEPSQFVADVMTAFQLR